MKPKLNLNDKNKTTAIGVLAIALSRYTFGIAASRLEQI